MAYSFDQIFAVDESNTSNVAKNASVLIFAPGDATKTPLTITTTDGQPLANPVVVNSAGFGPAFMHATLDRVAWEGAGYTGFFTAYEGLKDEAVAAREAAQMAANSASETAADRVTGAAVDVSGKLILTKASGSTLDAGSVIGPVGPQGDKGADGSNVLPTDTAIKERIEDPASATRGALNSAFTRLPAVADRTIFVTPRGNDANDGLTLKTAKATIAAGLSALENNPGRVQLGVGTTTTSATHGLYSGQEIRGSGRGSTTISYTGAGSLFTTGIPGTRTYNQVIDGVYIVGPGIGSTALAVDAADISNLTLSDFTISSFGTAYKNSAVVNGGAVYNHVTNGSIQACGTGAMFRALGSNGSRWHGVKFGGNTIAVDILDSNQNNFHACQFEVNTTAIKIDATLAGTSDFNSFSYCRFESNTTSWNIVSSNVRYTEITWPAIFGTYTYTDNGTGTNHQPGGSYQNKLKSALSSATGSWVFERYANGSTENPATRFVDSATTSGTPVTVQIETERSAGYFLRGVRGGVTYFDIDAAGNMRFPQGGSLSFAGSAVPKSADVQIFTADGTWTMPAGAKSVEVVLIGGGGGGGSGRQGAAATVRCGGGGGAGAAVTRLRLPASSLTSPVAVTVGLGGAGGAAVTAADTSGNAGGAGSASVFGSYARANGGAQGTGGTATAGAGGASQAIGMFASGSGANASATGLVGPAGTGAPAAAGGGGAGGGITTADATSGGGTGGAVYSFNATGTGTGGAAGAAGTVGTASATSAGIPGQGSGGGGSSTTGAAGNGATGAIYGGGGGGGGASVNGNNSGAGGAGGNGLVIVTTTF